MSLYWVRPDLVDSVWLLVYQSYAPGIDTEGRLTFQILHCREDCHEVHIVKIANALPET